VKDAFRAEWLSSVQVNENDEIFTTLKWLFDSFTTGHDVSGKTPMQLLQCGGSAAEDFQEASSYLVSISNRFYPRLQVNTIFVAVHAKVGYEVLMCDFNVPHMPLHDRVRLFVGQKDKTETSTCIVTPPQVNILLNGHQVEKRVTTGYLDAGPQMPSDVTHLVKVGSNVLQAIGDFSGLSICSIICYSGCLI
jgi:E3 SUMO-protein ligase PIAS1